MPEDIRHFSDELHLLTARLREMGVAAEAQVSRAMRALVYSIQGLDGLTGVRAPGTIFDRVRLAGVSPSPRGA